MPQETPPPPDRRVRDRSACIGKRCGLRFFRSDKAVDVRQDQDHDQYAQNDFLLLLAENHQGCAFSPLLLI